MLRYHDGFDHYTTTADAIIKWGASSNFGSGTGRSTGNCMVCTGSSSYVLRTFDSQQIWYVGVAIMRTSAASVGQLVSFRASSAQVISVQWDTAGKLHFYKADNTSIITSTGGEVALSLNTWYYLEIKVKISSSITAGDCSIWIDGTQYSTYATATDFRGGTASSAADHVAVGNITGASMTGNYSFDDFYACDSQGSSFNALLGPCYVTTLMPNGAGSNTAWTPLSGANYANVNEVPEDGDTSYVSTATTGSVDTYTTAGLPDSPANIFAVQVSYCGRATGSDIHRVSNAVRSGGTNYFGTTPTSALSTSVYAFITSTWTTDPATSVAWTKSGIAAMEAGQKLVS